MSVFTTASNLFVAGSIEEFQLREAINHGNFEGVAELLFREKSMKRMRRHRKFMEVLD
jgi:hypothetical protein